MATTKQTKSARSTAQKAQSAAKSQRAIARLSPSAPSARGRQGAAVASRKPTGSSAQKTRAELYELARKRDLAGRSLMGRDELARKLGVS